MISSTFESEIQQNQSKNFYEIIWEFSNSFHDIHGWLSVIICSIGILFNLTSVLVLTRANMINSSTNLILIALSISDVMTMLTSLVNSIYFYLMNGQLPITSPSPERDTKFWAFFSKLHTMSSVTFHSISVWLTIYIALFRCILLKYHHPKNNQNELQKHLLKCCRYRPTMFGIIFIMLFCVLFCLPTYLYPQTRVGFININETETRDSDNIKGSIKYYYVDQSDLNILTNGLIFKLMFYLQALLGKIIPSVLLVIINTMLVKSLLSTKSDEHYSSSESSICFEVNAKPLLNRNKPQRKQKKRENESLRTTIMLTTLSVCFLIAEFPQSILILLSIILGNDFYNGVYLPLGDVIDIIVLVNKSVDFIIYCTLSKSFRNTFLSMFGQYKQNKKSKSTMNKSKNSITLV